MWFVFPQIKGLGFSDIVKVSLLALKFETSCTRIPEPNANISGVLSIILDLLPYEEAELLDHIREAVLQPSGTPPMEEYLLEIYF